MTTAGREHLAHVDKQLSAIRRLRHRLAGLVESAGSTRPPGSGDLLALVEEVNKVEGTVKKYFTPVQLDTLAVRRETLGEQAIKDVEQEWPILIASVQAELDAGTDPAEPRVQELTKRWMALLETFHGGDPELRDSLYRMRADNNEQIQVEYGGPSPELIAYVGRANAAATD